MSHFHDPFRPSSARPDGYQTPSAQSSESEDTSSNVPSGTTKEVLAWVDGDKERAQQALDVEESHDDPRKGLVKELNQVLDD